jgi:hypothetical protein
MTPLFGQGYAPNPNWGIFFLDGSGNVVESGDFRYSIFFTFTYVRDVKTLTFSVKKCPTAVKFGPPTTAGSPGGPPPPPSMTFSQGTCEPIGKDPVVEGFSAIQEKVSELFAWANGSPWNVVYKVTEGTPGQPRALFTTIAPSAPPDPTIVFQDGLSGKILQFDFASGNVTSQVTPPQTAVDPLAIRPALFPPFTEVWVANGGLQVSVLNMSAQTVVTNIRTPSVPAGALPTGIVFTNGGDQAFEAFRLLSPDASGNSGLLVVFDAVNRVVTSTFPLKYGPTAVLMSPDGLTAYLLGSGGQLTYYDVLSGTADLSFSTYAPGSGAGYNGVSNVFIHPDGTRLFWAVGTYLVSFNLTTRKVVAQFNSGLPTTSATTLEVSQDGSIATMGNGLGMVVVLDTQYGIVQATLQNSDPTLMFPAF